MKNSNSVCFFFFQAEDGIRDLYVTGVQTCALPILARFAAYAFCKAHAAGYGRLGWQCAYLKARFPAEYAVGVLNHHAGMYPTWVHVEDLRRHGVEFRAPCVRRSRWDATLEIDGGAERT